MIRLDPLVGDRRTRDVPAQPFERLAPMLPAAHPGMQAKQRKSLGVAESKIQKNKKARFPLSRE